MACFIPARAEMMRVLCQALAVAAGLAVGPALAEQIVEIVVVNETRDRPPIQSKHIVWPADEGLAGARLGITDNQSKGTFLGQTYVLTEIAADPGGITAKQLTDLVTPPGRLLVLNTGAATLRQVLAHPASADDIVVNAGSYGQSLREGDCAPNLLHTLPSYAMLADALSQFLVMRGWTDVMLIEGLRPQDADWADAIRRSAAKFRLDLVEDVKWENARELRRDFVQDVPLFTKARRYDVVAIADMDRDFGEYVLYNTWLARPVVGSAGLRTVAWSHVIERWGAVQLQNRFEDSAGRPMLDRDYAVWLAVITLGEAVTATRSTDPAALWPVLLSPDFFVAGFKGARLSFRDWNGQMRQPIPLVQPNAVVAMAPLPGFEHQHTDLDTLGRDRAENQCPHTIGG